MRRAARLLDTAALELKHGDPDSAASRAYYAAFHAVSALFLLEGRSFRKHSALEAAVHKDLVHAGRWPEAVGQHYKFLSNLRSIGDYGGIVHVAEEDAGRAIEYARSIIQPVRNTTGL